MVKNQRIHISGQKWSVFKGLFSCSGDAVWKIQRRTWGKTIVGFQASTVRTVFLSRSWMSEQWTKTSFPRRYRSSLQFQTFIPGSVRDGRRKVYTADFLPSEAGSEKPRKSESSCRRFADRLEIFSGLCTRNLLLQEKEELPLAIGRDLLPSLACDPRDNG